MKCLTLLCCCLHFRFVCRFDHPLFSFWNFGTLKNNPLLHYKLYLLLFLCCLCFLSLNAVPLFLDTILKIFLFFEPSHVPKAGLVFGSLCKEKIRCLQPQHWKGSWRMPLLSVFCFFFFLINAYKNCSLSSGKCFLLLRWGSNTAYALLIVAPQMYCIQVVVVLKFLARAAIGGIKLMLSSGIVLWTW